MTKKLYLEEPYLKECNSKVVEKFFDKGKMNLVLDQTIFYPFNSNQPNDIGDISGIKVENVFIDEDKVIHTISKEVDSIFVDLNIDWDTRFDNMQQKTATVLFRYGCEKLFAGKYINSIINDSFSVLSVHSTDFDERLCTQVELYVNKIIMSAFPIKSYFRSSKSALEAKFEIENLNHQAVQTIEIDPLFSYDYKGLFLKNTGEIGLFKIIDWEKVEDVCNIKFIAGLRALNDYFKKF